jgi:hypothetical protein
VQLLAETGVRLDQRYRLDQLRRRSGGVTLWRATDEVLGRPVAVRIVGDRTKAQFKDLTAAVGRAGQVPDARWVRVLDVGSESRDRRLTTWIVSEWVEGPTLAAMLRRDPLRGPFATALVLSCAQAVAAAQRVDAHHGALHPDEVIVPADGSPRLTGLELSGVLRAAKSDADGDAAAAAAYDDIRGLGGLLYACLTGRWPLPGWRGLPAPSRGDGRHPRQQRGGVSRELDTITARALSGGYSEITALMRDLSALPMAPLHPEPPEPHREGESRWRNIAWRVVPPLLVAGVAAGAWFVGSELGRVPSPARAVAPHFPQPHHRGGGHQQVVWAKPPHISSFDPQGDGTEDPGGVGFAVDDDPSTQWTTDLYRDNPQFGGLKSGLGLLIDLGRPKTVRSADLLLSAAGAGVQIRAGSAFPHQAIDLPIVAQRANTTTSTQLPLDRPVTARYWLVWFTSLPKAGSEYQLGVAEVALRR